MNAAEAVALYGARQIRDFLHDDFNFGHSYPNEKHRSAADYLAREAKVPVRRIRAAGRLLMGELFRFAGVRACASCGCTDNEACPGGCRWVDRPRIDPMGHIVGENLCSACAPRRRRKAGHRG